MNLKDIIIPEPTENTVSISDITENFKGIILAFSKDKTVGYVTYDNCYWVLCNSIDNSNYMSTEYVYLTELIKDYPEYSFKAIEFK